MKIKLRKTVAVCLSVLCFLSMPVSAEDMADIASNAPLQTSETEDLAQIAEENTIPEEIKEEAGLLTALSIIPEDIDFSQEITREETAVLLCKMLGKESLARSSTTVRYYEDVSANSPNLGYINVVTAEGLFQGRSERIFAPESVISYNEFAKLLVTATGYSMVAEKKGGYPNGYIAVALQNKILEDVNYASRTTVNWKDAVQMVYNAMHVDLLSSTVYGNNGYVEYGKEEGNNLLSSCHDVYAARGQVTGTVLCRLFGIGGSQELKIGDVEISGFLYSYNPEKTAYIETMTGYNVKYFYKKLSSDEFELVYAYSDRSSSITVMSYDIEEVYGFDTGEAGSCYLKYFDEDTMKRRDTLSLDEDLSLVINYETVPRVTNAGLFPECGKVILIDSDSDNKYDVALVTQYDMRVVDVVSMYDKHIFFKSGDPVIAATPLVLNTKYFDVTYDIVQDGEMLSLTELREGDVIGIVKSTKDKSPYYQIEVLSSSFEGVAEEISEDEIKIDGKVYKVSPSYDFNLNPIKLGDTYTYYFDFADELFYAEFAEVEYTFEYVLLNAGKKKGLNGNVQVKLCYHATHRNKYVEIYDLADKVKINGTKYSGDAILDKLRLSSYNSSQVANQEYLQPLRRVEFDSEGKIKLIETVEEGVTHPRALRTYLGEGPYDESFRDTETGETINITYQTHFVYVPNYLDDDDNWLYSELSKLKFDKNYTTVFWGETDEGMPEVVFVYHDNRSNQENFMINDQRPMLVKKVTGMVDRDTGADLHRIETLNSGGTFVYVTDERNSGSACFDDLKPGDVIFSALTGEIEENATKVAQIQGGDMWGCVRQIRLSDPTVSYYKTLTQMYGRVETIRPEPRLNKCVINVNFGDLDGDGEDEFKSFDITGVPIYYFDRGTKEASVATYAAVKSAEAYGISDASDVFICLDEEMEPNMVAIVGKK